MYKRAFKNKCHSVIKMLRLESLALLFFFVPLFPKVTSILIAVCALLSLATFNKTYLKNLIEKKDFIIYIVLYLWLLFGLMYTTNLESGMLKVQTQLSLFILPFFLGGYRFSTSTRLKCLLYYISGLTVAVILCFTSAFYRALTLKSFFVIDQFDVLNNVFFYQEFSNVLDLHPTYFALYLGIGLFCLAYHYNLRQSLPLWLYVLVSVLLFIALILTSSKAGISIFFLSICVYILYFTISKPSKLSFGLFLALILGSVILFSTTTTLNRRILKSVASFNAYLSEEKFVYESTSVRLYLWALSIKTANESMLFGYGTGSTERALNQHCLNYYAFSTCERLRNKNGHNQFLDFLISNGVIFVLLLTIAMGIGVARAIRTKDKLLLIFIFFMTLNFLFESIIQRERGIVLFMLFIVILSVTDCNNKELKR